ncbi:MAG: UDP-N-acetylmuramate dehydrogenase [Candidatus Peregrinibacteria bacterium]
MNFEYSSSLGPFSTFRVGGPAKILAKIKTKADLVESVVYAQKENLPLFPLGGGSNILFADAGLEGMVLLFQNDGIVMGENTGMDAVDGMGAINRAPTIVESGTKNSALYQYVKKQNLDFSVFSTIPGTVGGAVCGNAGIPGVEIADFFASATVFNTETLVFETFNSDFFQFSYRSSIFHRPEISQKYLLWDMTLVLPSLPEVEIAAKAKILLQTRKEKQPWGLTGGSFFKNPPEGAAGYFLDQVGAKQMREGDAFFSDKHANFMMNAGNATQKEILDLAKKGAKAVYEKFNISLVPEVRILDAKGVLQKWDFS